jgi:hypothetical protein
MAKNATIRAIRRAGFNEDNFPNLQEYIMVTEPEAAAAYTARTLRAEHGEFLRVRIFPRAFFCHVSDCL